MLVHLGNGYFVEKNAIQYVRPRLDKYNIMIVLNEDVLEVPYEMLNQVIAALDKRDI